MTTLTATARRTLTPTRDRGTWDRGALLVRAALPAALALWAVALLQGADLDAMGDLGLVTVLPPAFWAALVLLTAGFVRALHRRATRTRWYAGYVVALIVLLHATPALLYPTLRYAWAWKHVSVVDVLLARGGTLPTTGDQTDLYAHWPGFFGLNGLLVRGAGVESALSYAAWFPLLTNLALLGPLLWLYRSATRSRRVVWGGVWLFYGAAWVGQDYFSPQGFTLVLYAAVLAVVVRVLHTLPKDGRPSPYVWLLLAVVALVCISHPLTPLMLLSAFGALALAARNRPVALPLLLGTAALILVWSLTAARPYLAANLTALLQGPGGGPDNPGLLDLAGASDAAQAVAWTDRALSLSVAALAVAGLVRRRCLRRAPLALLALSPLPWLAVNSYGGEMIFRVYLFALVAAALPAAAFLLGPRHHRHRRHEARHRLAHPARRPALVTACLLAALAAFCVGYYGKEDAHYFPPGEVAAVEALFARAPAGALIVAASGDFPAAYTRYGSYDRLWLSEQAPADRRALARSPAAGLRALVPAAPAGETGRPVYVVLTRSQEAGLRATGQLPAATVDRLADALDRSPAAKPVHRGEDGVVYRYRPGRAEG